jgi:cysteine desulfurase
MDEVLDRDLANPSSLHGPGREARHLLTRVRRRIGELLGAARDEVVFTGNGSEANLLALRGAAGALPPGRRHVLVTPVEHPSVLDPLEDLGASGQIDLETLPVDGQGRVEVRDLEDRLRPETGLISMMLANNELGTLQPVEELVALARPRGILVHCDAVQAVGKIALPRLALDADLVTVSPHKFGGPRGVGILVKRGGVNLATPLSPRRQEQGLRGGTEDVVAAVGAAAALETVSRDLDQESARLRRLQVRLFQELPARFPGIVLHTPPANTVPTVVNLSFPTIPGAWLVAALDRLGVAVSHGSACSSLAAVPSHVLEAVGAGSLARCAVRISMGRGTSEEHVEDFMRRLRVVLVETSGSHFLFASQNGCNQ